MGTKEKFWFQHSSYGRSLFKSNRPASGEDWSEKVASELASALGIPAVKYELAVSEAGFGVITPSFVLPEQVLVHGNEILTGTDAKYAIANKEADGRTPLYTVPLVLSAIEQSKAEPPAGYKLPEGIADCISVFLGYLLLDGWIGNTDRHHENWAIVVERDKTFLAPLYDSASCLGRNESDTVRLQRLQTRDSGFSVEAYAARAKSAFFSAEHLGKLVHPVEAFRTGMKLYPAAGRVWLSRLAMLPDRTVQELFAMLPAQRVSEATTRFAMSILNANKKSLLDLIGEGL